MNPFESTDPSATSVVQADVRSWLAAIVDSSSDAIISKTLDGVITTWNGAAQRLFGYTEAEAVGQPITLIIPTRLQDEEKDILSRIRAGERIEHFETCRVARDGRLVDVSITVSPVRDARGTVVGASKVLRDLTDTRRTQTALRESEQRLAHELGVVRTLQSISTRLIAEVSQRALFEQILNAAMELMAAEAASVQMLASDGESLTLLAWRNFHPDSAAFWRRVTAGTATTCGMALRDHERVLVADVESCAFMADTPDLEEYRRCGIRAMQSTPLRSRSGSLIGMLSTHWTRPNTPTADNFRSFDVLARQAADLIERMQAESAVRESEERFRRIANAVPVTIWMTDLSMKCTYINQTWLDLTGQSVETALGTGWASEMHPADLEPFWNAFARVYERREPFQLEFRVRGRDGDYRSLVGTGVPRYEADGSFGGYIGSAVDITERRLTEEALATIKQREIDAQERERARIARELHDDIQQRLALLALSLDGLSKSAPITLPESRTTLDAAGAEVVRLAQDVQTLSHRLHPAQIERLGIVRTAAALCREMSSQHGIEVQSHVDDVPDDLPERISVCLYRVLQEALQNAIKHGGVTPVEVSLHGLGSRIELTVADRGAGFDPESNDRSGLGLTSMKERLTAVGGQLLITSRREQGTTVRAQVPLLRSEPFTPSNAPRTISSQRLRVLIADDDPGLGTAVRRLLSASCDIVGNAVDSASLFEAAVRLQPDIVLLDFSLPGGLDGIDVCRCLKAIAPDVRVVAFTGCNDPEIKRLWDQEGAAGFVWKLEAPDDLLLMIHTVCERRRGSSAG